MFRQFLDYRFNIGDKKNNGKRLLPFVFLVFLISICGCTTDPYSSGELIPTETQQVSISDEKTIRLANGDWPPYNSEKLQNGGCDSMVISETFALAGYDVEFGYFPWARSYSLSETGTWDGTLAWDDTPDHRTDHWISTEPTSVQEWVFFYVANDDFDWNSIEDLRGKTIGVTTGYVYSDAFIDYSDDEIDFVECTSDEANFKMLLAGRIDIFPMEKEVGLYLINEVFSPEEQAQITYDEKPLSEFHSHLLLSKAIPENEEIIKEFNQAFQDLIQSGRYDAIMQQCSYMGRQ